MTTYHLPASVNHRIYLVTDTHFEAKRPHHFDDILVQARQSAPDSIIFAGDTLNYLDDIKTPESRQFLRQFFKKLSKIAPVYIGVGNHDQMFKSRKFYPEREQKDQQIFLDFMNSIPEITLVHNNKVKISSKANSKSAGNLYLVGLTLPCSCFQMPYSAATRETVENLQKVLKKHQNLLKKEHGSDTNLLLVHSPRRFTPEVVDSLTGVDYILTGHMHQGCIPFGLDEKLPGTRGLIAPGYAPFPERARMPRAAFASPLIAPSRAASLHLSDAPASRSPEKLLVFPAYKTFAGHRRPLNILFPRSHSLLRLTN